MFKPKLSNIKLLFNHFPVSKCLILIVFAKGGKRGGGRGKKRRGGSGGKRGNATGGKRRGGGGGKGKGEFTKISFNFYLLFMNTQAAALMLF